MSSSHQKYRERRLMDWCSDLRIDHLGLCVDDVWTPAFEEGVKYGKLLMAKELQQVLDEFNDLKERMKGE